MTIEAAYIALFKTGELKRRTEALEARLESCDICPRDCGINRLKDERGFCHSGRLPIVSSVCPHHGEEPALSGTRGSGTIFFGNCNMRCVYCQNHQISQDWKSQQYNEVDHHTLSEHMLHLQKLGCHNINLVTPSHFVPQILRALLEAVPMGLHLPLVYNSSGYDSLNTVKALDGVVDIYLPDIRYASDESAVKYSQAPEYVARDRDAIKEMHRQVGDLKVDGKDVAYRGVIVRHLILPDRLAGSKESLTWLAGEVSPEIAVSIMSQYFPAYRAREFLPISRTITCPEYAEVAELVAKLGLENGWLQEMDAPENYLPDFRRKEHPFEPVPKT